MIYATDMKYLLYISFGMYFGSKPVIPADNELHIYFETMQANVNWKHVLFGWAGTVTLKYSLSGFYNDINQSTFSKLGKSQCSSDQVR